MITIFSTPGVRRRAIAILCLALLAGGLVTVKALKGGASGSRPPETFSERQDMDAAIDSVLVHHGIVLSHGRTSTIRASDKSIVRRETRFEVSPAFLSLSCNCDLNRAVAPYDARVIATEHTKEQIVAMHIRKDGMIVRTLVFVTVSGS